MKTTRQEGRHEKHGPRVLISDNGSENDNDLMKEVIKVLGMTRHIKMTPCNPRSDGQVEKHMATLKDHYRHM